MDHSSTLLFLDHPDNESIHWFVRNNPFPAVDPSFAFFDPVKLVAGDTLRFRCRIVIADGAWHRSRLESYVEDHPW